MKATAKELRFHSKELLDAVSRGASVVITFRGKPCAKLVPYEDNNLAEYLQSEDGLFGTWRDRDDVECVDGYVRDLRKSRFS
ncbi:type II toxin-antitoxin system Phd/YefM family antitoxin [Methyloglobulus sp.]|uniref:type II toxin-antitoxin system Phd/YefM family antitoxin n=1 Tax=Methyloglobulus sp. TaxID=2518622 RepID=UPI003988F09F